MGSWNKYQKRNCSYCSDKKILEQISFNPCIVDLKGHTFKIWHGVEPWSGFFVLNASLHHNYSIIRRLDILTLSQNKDEKYKWYICAAYSEWQLLVCITSSLCNLRIPWVCSAWGWVTGTLTVTCYSTRTDTPQEWEWGKRWLN